MNIKCILFFVMMYAMGATVMGQRRTDYGNNRSVGKYYSVRGIKLYAEQYGSGKPLLLLHGNAGSISSMGAIIPWFSRFYKVIAVDSRAHGNSTDTGDSLSFEMMADDNAALLDILGIDSVDVIGWSDGGIVALELAIRHPKKVSRFAASGANINADSTAFTPASWQESKAYYDSAHLRTFSGAKEKNDWKIFMLDWLQPAITFGQLEQIVCPALIISGDHDMINLDHSIAIFRHIRNARLWVMPDAGHGTFAEHTGDFQKTVHDFFTAHRVTQNNTITKP